MIPAWTLFETSGKVFWFREETGYFLHYCQNTGWLFLANKLLKSHHGILMLSRIISMKAENITILTYQRYSGNENNVENLILAVLLYIPQIKLSQSWLLSSSRQVKYQWVHLWGYMGSLTFSKITITIKTNYMETKGWKVGVRVWSF